MRLLLLLPLLLVLSQHGAWLHELSHAAYAANPHQSTVQRSDAPAEHGLCPGCQSFGQLGGALAGSPATVRPPLARICPQLDPQYSQPAAQLSAPRNRGPPRLA